MSSLLAHELAHIRQQQGPAISMLPQEDIELEVDPDQQLEREADEAAEQALTVDEPLTVNRMESAVEIQWSANVSRSPARG
jgi:Zn-dependent peptidase ImmA (M78 family)